MKRRTLIAASALAGSLCAMAAPAFAQDAVVEEIIVTAQKREQSLQDVPIVVSVVSGQQLADAGVRDVKDLQTVVPGLNVTSSTSEAQTSIRIRGVGTIGDNPGMEASVGTVVDGVYRARSGVAFGDLGEMARVEVLKGPQGTLFGKNTSAGVISVITKEPSFDFGAEGELTLGEYNARGVSLSVTGPIAGDTLAGRLYMAHRERDGFYDVSTGEGPRTRTDDQDQNFDTFRGQLLWRPSDDLKVRILADYTERDEHCCTNVTTFVGATGAMVDALATDAGTLRPANPFARLSYANRDSAQKIKDRGVSAEVTWNINADVSLTSITAQRKWDLVQGSDIDYSSADIWYRAADGSTFQKFDVFSQELRLAGVKGPVDWLVGAFYADEQLESGAFTRFGADYEPYFGLLLSSGASTATVAALTGRAVGTNYIPGEGARDSYDHSSKGWALFTNNTWKVTDAFELTLGLRYTNEEKEVLAHYTNTVPAAACSAALARPLPAAAKAAICPAHADPAFNNLVTRQTRDENRWGGTLKASYRFSPALMTYGSYASGFKSGGFNLDRSRVALGVANPDTSFPAETVEAWEAGAKSTLLGSTLLLNGAVFHQKFQDFQLNTYTGVAFLVASIPSVVSRGVDVDVLWRTPVDGLDLSGGLTYAETQYGAFTPPAGISARLPHTRLGYAPLWSGSLGGSYERDLGENLVLRASLSAKYTSSYNTGSNLDPAKVQGPMTIVNGRVAVGSQSGRWTLEAWAQNLTNKDYYQVVVDQPLQSGTYAAFLGAPRTAGMTLRIRY